MKCETDLDLIFDKYGFYTITRTYNYNQFYLIF